MVEGDPNGHPETPEKREPAAVATAVFSKFSFLAWVSREAIIRMREGKGSKSAKGSPGKREVEPLATLDFQQGKSFVVAASIFSGYPRT
jgi:hypothetical protein